MTTVTPFTINGIPATPGAYLINTNSGSYPIFCSVYDLSSFMGAADQDNFWLVMPNYTVVVYKDTGYSSDAWSTSSSSTIQSVVSTYGDSASSVRLYYGGTEVKISGISY